MVGLQAYLDVTMLCLAKAEQEGQKVIMTGRRRRLLPGLDHKHRADQLTQLCLQPMELVGIGKCTLLQVNNLNRFLLRYLKQLPDGARPFKQSM